MKDKYNKKFDLIFSIGNSCFISMAIRKCHLQISSYPMDWLGWMKIEKAVEFLVTDFRDFLNKEDLKQVDEFHTEINDTYLNTKHDFYLVHDFPKNIDFEEQFETVKIKYNKRIKRLLKKINQSKKVLIAYMTTEESKIEDIQNQMEQCDKILKLKYPNVDFHYIYIINTKNKNYIYKNNKFNLTIISQDYNTPPTFNKENNPFKKYKINRNFRETINCFKYYLIKVLINIIPNKNIRLQLKHFMAQN